MVMTSSHGGHQKPVSDKCLRLFENMTKQALMPSLSPSTSPQPHPTRDADKTEIVRYRGERSVRNRKLLPHPTSCAQPNANPTPFLTILANVLSKDTTASTPGSQALASDGLLPTVTVRKDGYLGLATAPPGGVRFSLPDIEARAAAAPSPPPPAPTPPAVGLTLRLRLVSPRMLTFELLLAPARE